MNHPDLLQTAATVKDLCEKVAKQLPFPCKVVLECNEPEAPEIIINEWIIITPFLDEAKAFVQVRTIRYAIAHIVNYPSYNRDVPDDVDVEDDITVDSPWQAIREAFKLLILNDLDMTIQSINEDEMVMDHKRNAEQSEALKAHMALFDPSMTLYDPL